MQNRSLNRIASDSEKAKTGNSAGCYGKQQYLRWRANRRGGPASGQGTINYAAGIVGRQPGGGRLTSLDAVRLVLLVEDEFNIEIPVSELTLANFRSISTISLLVTKLLSLS